MAILAYAAFQNGLGKTLENALSQTNLDALANSSVVHLEHLTRSPFMLCDWIKSIETPLTGEVVLDMFATTSNAIVGLVGQTGTLMLDFANASCKFPYAQKSLDLLDVVEGSFRDGFLRHTFAAMGSLCMSLKPFLGATVVVLVHIGLILLFFVGLVLILLTIIRPVHFLFRFLWTILTAPIRLILRGLWIVLKTLIRPLRTMVRA